MLHYSKIFNFPYIKPLNLVWTGNSVMKLLNPIIGLNTKDQKALWVQQFKYLYGCQWLRLLTWTRLSYVSFNMKVFQFLLTARWNNRPLSFFESFSLYFFFFEIWDWNTNEMFSIGLYKFVSFDFKDWILIGKLLIFLCHNVTRF